MKRFYAMITAGILLSLIQACGGGGGGGGGGGTGSSVPTYAGLTSEAQVEDANAESLSTTAASGALQSVAVDSAGGAFTPRSAPSLEGKLVEVSPRIAKWIASSGLLYSAKTFDVSGEICDAGGSAVADTNDAETVGTITFTDCGISDGTGGVIYMTGTVDYTIGVVGGNPETMSMTFHVTMTYGGETAALNMSLNCVDLSGSANCSVSSDFVGIDGRVYRVMDIDVIVAGSGYYVTAAVYDPDYGRIGMTTISPLAFDCPNGVPSTGTIEISGSSATSGLISFVSCSEYNVTINSVATTYSWP